MEQVAPKGSRADQPWATIMRQLRLTRVTRQGLQTTDHVLLDGLLHMIGMVGSGKSTKLMVFATQLARQGKRTVLIQSDVASLLRSLEIFEQLRKADPRIRAVPLVGRSARILHVNRLSASLTQAQIPVLQTEHPGFRMLSTVCALDGLRRDVAPLDPGDEPCTRLVQEDGGREIVHDCPIMPRCPVHTPSRELMEATIWLVTPASLLASGPQEPLFAERVQNAELVLRTADVVLVDEADLVQIQFDNQFAQIQVLVGKNDSWLDRVANQVARQVYRPGRLLIGNHPGLDAWLTAHTNTQRAVDRLYFWIRDRKDTRIWLHKRFSAGSLFAEIKKLIEDYNWPPDAYAAACDAFEQAAPGSVRPRSAEAQIPEPWNRAIDAELFVGDDVTAQRLLTAWCARAFEVESATPAIDVLTHKLRIALIVGVLDHALQDMIDHWPDAAPHLELDRGSGGLFFGPSDSLTRLVPEAPMGGVIGFQYWDPDYRGDGELRFFRVRGIGRALLYHMHTALQRTDNVAGPHVILTSATSWAPHSWRYHVHHDPTVVLLPQVPEDSAAKLAGKKRATIECFFSPIPDPEHPSRLLYVSGRLPHDRMRNLRAMVTDLARPQGFDGKSKFETELEQLPKHRRRILLVVGSYVEAAEVAAALREARRLDPGDEDVVALIPDPELESGMHLRPDTLVRSLLAQLPNISRARFLVAPLLSIERGHNIVVGLEAALGSVYFLTRPMPVPGDPHTAVQRLNAWASIYVPTLKDMSPLTAGLQLRHEAARRWRQALVEQTRYIDLKERDPLLWTQLVLVWQCIGRLVRGGVKARVHFIDAKWAPASSNLVEAQYDTEETSMLIGFERILRDVLEANDPVTRDIADALYGAFAEGLSRTDGLRRRPS